MNYFENVLQPVVLYIYLIIFSYKEIKICITFSLINLHIKYFHKTNLFCILDNKFNNKYYIRALFLHQIIRVTIYIVTIFIIP